MHNLPTPPGRNFTESDNAQSKALFLLKNKNKTKMRNLNKTKMKVKWYPNTINENMKWHSPSQVLLTAKHVSYPQLTATPSAAGFRIIHNSKGSQAVVSQKHWLLLKPGLLWTLTCESTKVYKNYPRRKVNQYFTKRYPKPVFINHKKPILLNITLWIQWRRKAGPSKVAPKMAKINSISGLLWTKQIYMGLLWTNM